ncbi:MAG: RsmD family RNA methyltransferase [Patescibacteria group bacterium]|nr:RsmD family RNA methyltransferase [Patescibacteria group bacterium]
MHIGTGKFEGKEIKDNHEGAPLSTRILTIKESIFEIIGIRIHEASVLDINDTNGMYGIEAISKGAAVVQFLNLHDEDKELIRENLKAVGLNPDDFILEKSPNEFFSQKTNISYDIIFFRAIDLHCFELLERVLNFQSENGVTVIQYPDSDEFSLIDLPKDFQIIDTRQVETDKFSVILKKK